MSSQIANRRNCFGLAFLIFFAQSAVADRVVTFKTPLGIFDILLLEDEAPVTVQNFLGYVNRGDYTGTFIHRSVPGFVLQAGGYAYDPLTNSAPHIDTQPPIINEFGRSNIRGTVAMAKSGGDPNSATSEWFVNLADNSVNLDNQNGGFTVFGIVINNGMEVVDKIAALPRPGFGGVFADTPAIDFSGTIESDTFVTLDFICVSGGAGDQDELETSDFDGDGVSNCIDTDDDNDGVSDSDDLFPLDDTESRDHDNDGRGDNADTDDDNDGVDDIDDLFPFDVTESGDQDGDGQGDNADKDDDNDGLSDLFEVRIGLDPNVADNLNSSLPVIFWRNSVNGANSLWFMASEILLGKSSIVAVSDPDWEVEGMANFVGDRGSQEIFFRHQSRGENRIWSIRDGARESSLATTGAHPDWTLMAMADFDADGDADLMWRNSKNGANRYWEMDSTLRRSSLAIRGVSLEWEMVGSGDFNNDGKGDLVWRNQLTGGNIVWLMESESILHRANLASVSTAWKIVGIGDFDADGFDDLLWRNTASGYNTIWTLNGAEIKSRVSINAALPEWTVFAVSDLNDDSKADILWRNTQTGANRLWLMDGGYRVSSLPIESQSKLSWTPVAVGTIEP